MSSVTHGETITFRSAGASARHQAELLKVIAYQTGVITTALSGCAGTVALAYPCGCDGLPARRPAGQRFAALTKTARISIRKPFPIGSGFFRCRHCVLLSHWDNRSLSSSHCAVQLSDSAGNLFIVMSIANLLSSSVLSGYSHCASGRSTELSRLEFRASEHL